MRDMTAKELDLYYRENKCSNCGRWNYLRGPCGGCTINLKCGTCGMEISVDDSGLCCDQGAVLVEPAMYVIPPNDPPVEDLAEVVVAFPKRSWRTLWF